MHRVITIHLHGHPTPFELDDDAYDALRRYLDGARAGLTDETDPGEVIDDLEQSIGIRLADRLADRPADRRVADDRILALDDIATVLAAVGPVGGDDRPGSAEAWPTPPTATSRRPRRRRLYRIRDDQQIAGVCTGIAAYSEIRLDWVRTTVVLLTVFSAGIFALVYIALAFLLPVVGSQEEWVAALDANETV